MYKWSIYIRKDVQHHQIWGKCKLNSQGGNIIPHSSINTIKETTSTGKMTQWTKSLPSVRNCIWVPGAYINLDASAIPSHLKARWEMWTGESPEAVRPASSAYVARNKNFCPKQGGRQGLTSKVVHWPPDKQSHLYSHAYMRIGINKWTHACTLHMHTRHIDLLNDNN